MTEQEVSLTQAKLRITELEWEVADRKRCEHYWLGLLNQIANIVWAADDRTSRLENLPAQVEALKQEKGAALEELDKRLFAIEDAWGLIANVLELQAAGKQWRDEHWHGLKTRERRPRAEV